MFANTFRPKTAQEIIASYEEVVQTARQNLLNSLEARGETLAYRCDDIEARIDDLQRELISIAREQESIDNYFEPVTL